MQITQKVGNPVKVEILVAEAQVVAGTNYKVKFVQKTATSPPRIMKLRFGVS